MAKNKDRAQLKNMSFKDIDAQADVKYKDFEYAWRNPEHKLPDGKPLTLKDALSLWESPIWIPRVVNNTMQEAIEPMLIATNMLQKVPFAGIGSWVDYPVMGALDGDFEVGETESFPELRVTYGAGAQIAQAPARYGVALKFTEDILRYSHMDVVTMVTSQAAKALARNKEEKIFDMWFRLARCSHDNNSPLDSAYGTSTGRDLTGALNGSLTMDDVFEMYAQGLAQGVTPDVIFVHPLTWLMFLQDANLRSIALASGGGWFGGQWHGSPMHQDFPDLFGGMAIPGKSYRTWPNAPANAGGGGLDLEAGAGGGYQNLQTSLALPGYMNVPFRLVVSPYVPYNFETNRTHLLMADSSQLGFFIEEHGPQVSEWTDPETDILKMKIKERYLIRPKNRGLGLVMAKNIALDSNKIILPAQSTIAVAGSISLADRLTTPY